MLGNYYPYPGVSVAPNGIAGFGAYYAPQMAVQVPLGATEASPASPAVSVFGWIAKAALKGVAGYYVGSFFGHPVAGAALSAVAGLPGLFALALFSASPVFALPNEGPEPEKGSIGPDIVGTHWGYGKQSTLSDLLSFGKKDSGAGWKPASGMSAKEATDHFWDGYSYGKRSCYRKTRRYGRRRRRGGW